MSYNPALNETALAVWLLARQCVELMINAMYLQFVSNFGSMPWTIKLAAQFH
jgi:hypothetical protein